MQKMSIYSQVPLVKRLAARRRAAKVTEGGLRVKGGPIDTTRWHATGYSGDKVGNSTARPGVGPETIQSRGQNADRPRVVSR